MFLKISLLVAILIAGIGLSMTFLQRRMLGFILGAALTIKAGIFAAAYIILQSQKKTDMPILIFSGLLFLLLFVLVCAALVIRNKRFGVTMGISGRSDLKY